MPEARCRSIPPRPALFYFAVSVIRAVLNAWSFSCVSGTPFGVYVSFELGAADPRLAIRAKDAARKQRNRNEIQDCILSAPPIKEFVKRLRRSDWLFRLFFARLQTGLSARNGFIGRQSWLSGVTFDDGPDGQGGYTAWRADGSTQQAQPDGHGGYTFWGNDGTTHRGVPDGHGGWTVY